ncbi:hypothetical protein [Actinoplanes friuliensis]|uniref:Uncharacterized protein n=1 Tax=Actinoplanes friuliensis DSM 7358 TaxID=1246995 RepID=U5VSX7_9ACTN|nr:hypothetical protein [Actinoplanes friuliensis]AGZ38751.1 hypothetical protein AFR_02310 [Actinoplanes friuliensis DSM 7358]
MRSPRVDATIFGAAPLLALALGGVPTERITEGATTPITPDELPLLIGEWLNPDHTVRLRLSADWSFEGRVEGRDRGAKGTYRPDGAGLVLRDVSGLRTAVAVAEDVLEMAGHQLFRA